MIELDIGHRSSRSISIIESGMEGADHGFLPLPILDITGPHSVEWEPPVSGNLTTTPPVRSAMADTVTFWLNDQLVETDEHEGLLVLDYLRKNRFLTGTKEGCKEGDCGACSILIGEVRDGKLVYEPVTSCLVPLGEMHGRHVVSIEGVNLDGGLNPVQEAMTRRGGAQCGFCTPGFIVSMCWYLMASDDENPSLKGFQRAFSGNLCRCTGYSSINRASEDLVAAFGPDGQYGEVWSADDRISALCGAGLLPAYFTEIPEKLAQIAPLDEERHDYADIAEYFVAGGTDLYVQEGEDIPRTNVKILNRHPEMRGIERDDEAGVFRVGALTSFEAFGQHPEIQAIMPRMDHYLYLIASLQLRVRATLSGNIINASPIGDMTNLLLALDTTLIFHNGSRERAVAMKEFFEGYKTYDKDPDEIMIELLIPIPHDDTRIHFEKVSKREALDIATVNSAAKLRVDDDGLIREASLTVGGVAAVPLWLEATGQFLCGRPLDAKTVRDGLAIAHTEMSPISDVRGSAAYKRLLAHQLLSAHFTELYGDRVSFDALMAG